MAVTEPSIYIRKLVLPHQSAKTYEIDVAFWHIGNVSFNTHYYKCNDTQADKQLDVWITAKAIYR